MGNQRTTNWTDLAKPTRVPSQTINHVFNAPRVNTKMFRQLAHWNARIVRKSNDCRVRWIKLCRPCNFAASRACYRTVLVVAVVAVFHTGSEPKMVRVHASRVVSSWAIVKHTQAIWHGTDDKQPRCSMCTDIDPFSGTTCMQKSMTVMGFGGSPQPAAFRFHDLAPKTSGESRVQSLRCEVLRGNFDHLQLFWPVRVSGSTGRFFITGKDQQINNQRTECVSSV